MNERQAGQRSLEKGSGKYLTSKGKPFGALGFRIGFYPFSKIHIPPAVHGLPPSGKKRTDRGLLDNTIGVQVSIWWADELE